MNALDKSNVTDAVLDSSFLLLFPNNYLMLLPCHCPVYMHTVLCLSDLRSLGSFVVYLILSSALPNVGSRHIGRGAVSRPSSVTTPNLGVVTSILLGISLFTSTPDIAL